VNRETAKFESLILEKLMKIRQERLEFVGAGVDVEMYRHWTGYIRCIKDVVDVIASAHKELDKD
jgi:hypothetical protein